MVHNVEADGGSNISTPPSTFLVPAILSSRSQPTPRNASSSCGSIPTYHNRSQDAPLPSLADVRPSEALMSHWPVSQSVEAPPDLTHDLQTLHHSDRSTIDADSCRTADSLFTNDPNDVLQSFTSTIREEAFESLLEEASHRPTARR